LTGEAILSVEGLTVGIDTAERSFLAVRDVSFDVRPGETYAIVGESGSGKSLTALSIMGLLPENAARVVAGSVRLKDEDLATATEQRLEEIRGNRISMVFQEPMTSLNPSMRVGRQVAEALELHRGMNHAEAMHEVVALFEKVRIADPERRLSEYPHRLSGGMRQRVMIALALACRPELIIADEPTTALDVTTQAQILKLFRDLQAEIGMATILITHDLAVVAETAERVAVMYAGRIVEEAPSEALFAAPRHPYSLGLLQSMPRIVGHKPGERRGRLTEIAGAVPPLWKLPVGCAYAPRCPFATERCHSERPPLAATEPGRRLACFHPVAAEAAA